MTRSTSPIAVRFDDDLLLYLERFVEENHTSKSDFIRQAVAEKLEDLYDIELADKAFENWVAEDKQTYSHEEMMKRYG